MTAESDEIDHHVAAKLVAILQGHASDANHGIGIFAVHVEDGNRQALGQVRREAAGVGFARVGGEADQVVDDDVHCAADGVAAQVGKVQGLGGDSLPCESRVAVHDERQDLQLCRRGRCASAWRARVPSATGFTASRWLGFDTR